MLSHELGGGIQMKEEKEKRRQMKKESRSGLGLEEE